MREKITDTNDSKKFYKYIKSKNSEIISVAPLKKGGNFIVDDKEKANILNAQYCRCFRNVSKTHQLSIRL